MLRWHLWQHIVVILTIHSHINSVSAVSPVSQTVFVNDTVEFQCQIRDTENYQLIWIADYDSSDDVVHVIPAEQNSDIDTLQALGEGHGKYSVDYYLSLDEFGENTVHHLTLRIGGVMLPDEGKYDCGYNRIYVDRFGNVVRRQPIFLGDSAYLTILEPPHEVNPSCAFKPDPLTLSSAQSSYMVTMTCQINGGRPLPSLTWNKKDTVISQASELNVLHYELSPEDNGVEFMCIASGPALVVDGSCSVVPLKINPSVVVTSDVHMPTQENVDLKLTCRGSGMPMISKLEWRYNEKAFSDINNMELEYQIVDISDSLSELHVFNVQYDHNNDVVTCYVEIPSGLNSHRSFMIMVNPDQTSTISITSNPTFSTHSFDVTSNFTKTVQPKSRSSFTSGFIVPLAAAFGGLIIILVAAILTTAVCRRKRQMKRNNSQTPIVIDRQRNTYQMGEIITERNPESAVSNSPDDAYVISELPGTRAATVVSDPPYDQLNPQSAPNTDDSYDQVNRPPASATDSPPQEQHYAATTIVDNDHQYNHLNLPVASAAGKRDTILDRNVEGLSYADIAEAREPENPTLHSDRSAGSGVVYSNIEGSFPARNYDLYTNDN